MAFVGPAIAGITSAVSSAAGAVSSAFSALGLGSGFWSALGVGATLFGTYATIQSNNFLAQSMATDAAIQAQAAALDAERKKADIRREREADTARRSTLLAVQGGLSDGADMVLDALLAGARAEERLATDLSFEQGALARRISNTMRGARLQNLGALAQGGARIADILSR